MLINARSLVQHTDELSIMLKNDDIDIAAITETWFPANIDPNFFSIPNYTLFSRPRTVKRGGGVALYLKETIQTRILTDAHVPDELEVLWAWARPPRLPRTISGLILCVVYYPPSSLYGELLIEYISASLDLFQAKYPGAGIVLLGDFNRLDTDLVCRLTGLVQVVNTPTRDQSILDKIMTNIQQHYKEPLSTSPIGRSDHNTVLWRPIINTKKINTIRKKVVRPIRDSDKRSFGQWITTFEWTGVNDAVTTNTKTTEFYSTLQSAIDTFFPTKSTSSHCEDKPWFSPELKSLILNRQKAYLSGKFHLWRFLRNKVARLIKSAKRNFYSLSVSRLKYFTPRQWHKQIKKIAGLDTHHNLNLQGTDPSAISNDINSRFTSVADDIPHLNIDNLPAYLPACGPPPSVTPEQVYVRLKKLKLNKSGDPDHIPPRLIKEFAYELSFPLSEIFNSSLHEGIVPDIWKSAYVVPVPKTRPARIEELRPISLTCFFAKAFEDFVVDWITKDIRASLDTNQFGSLKGLSTTHCLVKILNDIYRETDKPRQSGVLVTTDFSRAFDRVSHQLVIEKFIKLGVRPSIVPWICSFLTNRSQCVRFKNTYSNWETTNAGVPQGTKIGPVAFLALINDASTKSQQVYHYKYVDDMTLFQMYNDTEQTNVMQSELDRLKQWSDDNLMRLNPSKCHFMITNFQRVPPVPPTFRIGNTSITQSNCIKLLGIHVQDNLKWDSQVDAMCKSFQRKLYFLRLLKRSNLPIVDLKLVYVQYVRPSFEYSSQVWFSGLTKKQLECLERMQRKAFRIILTHTYCRDHSYSDICNELNIPPISERLESLLLKFGKSILNSSSLRGWLPPNRNNHLRNAAQLTAVKCRTSRYNNSCIPKLTSLLNHKS